MGKSGISYNYIVLNSFSECELYLDKGKEYPTINKERFDQLFKHKDAEIGSGAIFGK